MINKKQDRIQALENALRELLNVIETDKDGDCFICAEALDDVVHAQAVLDNQKDQPQ